MITEIKCDTSDVYGRIPTKNYSMDDSCDSIPFIDVYHDIRAIVLAVDPRSVITTKKTTGYVEFESSVNYSTANPKDSQIVLTGTETSTYSNLLFELNFVGDKDSQIPFHFCSDQFKFGRVEGISRMYRYHVDFQFVPQKASHGKPCTLRLIVRIEHTTP